MSALGDLGIGDLLASFALEPTGDGTFRAGNLPLEHGVTFGGQLLAQSLLAATDRDDGMAVKTIHTVFARPGSPADDLDITVEPLGTGRTFRSSTVTIAQWGRTITRSMVLLTSDEPDLIRHAEPAPAVGPPDDAVPSAHLRGAWEVRTVGGVDIDDPEAVGPARLDVWTRFVGAPTDPCTGQALLAFASDGFLIGTAMRPHAGVGQAQAHVTLATGVVSHTLTFHEPFRADGWLLLAHTSPYAGRGRAHGRADAFTADGRLVASYVQDSVIRAMPARAG